MQHCINFIAILHLQLKQGRKVVREKELITRAQSIKHKSKPTLCIISSFFCFMCEHGSERGTSSGVCSPRRRRPSNKNAIELKSTDCRSQYAFMSFFSWVLLLILKKTSFPSCNQKTSQIHSSLVISSISLIHEKAIFQKILVSCPPS